MSRVIDTNSAPHYPWGDNADGWHLLKTDQLCVIQERVPPGAGETRHLHQAAHQFFFLLEGSAQIEVEGEVFELQEGQGIHVPPGAAHRFCNPSDEPVHFLVMSSPDAQADRIDRPGTNQSCRAHRENRAKRRLRTKNRESTTWHGSI